MKINKCISFAVGGILATLIMLLGFSHAQTCDGLNTSYCNNLVSVTIYNSYSGNIQFASSLGYVLSGGNIWVSGSAIPLTVVSTKNTQYQILGTGVATTSGGSFSGMDNDILLSMLVEGINTASISFDSSGEFFSGNSLVWMHDMTAPSAPVILGPVDNSVIGGSAVNMSWGSSTETGVGFSGFVLELSMDGDWTNAIKIPVGAVQQYPLDLVGLPSGTYFWRVKSVDLLGNTSISLPGFFHVGTPSSVGSSANKPTGGNQGSFDVLIHDPNKSINPQQTPGCIVTSEGIVCQSLVVGLHSSSTVALDTKKSLIGNQMNQHLKGLDRTKIKLPGMLPKSGVEVDPEPYKKLLQEQDSNACNGSKTYNTIYLIIVFVIGCLVGYLGRNFIHKDSK